MHPKTRLATLVLMLCSCFTAAHAAEVWEAIASFEREGISLQMDMEGARSALEGRGYRLDPIRSHIPGDPTKDLYTRLHYVKGTRLDRSSVSFTFFKQEEMEYLSFNIPAGDGGNALQEEVDRLRTHFGEAIDKCRMVKRKGRLIKVPRCQLKGSSPSRDYNFVFMGYQNGYSYSIANKGAPGRVFAREQEKKTRSRYPCLERFDPEQLDEVYNCLGSLRHELGINKGKNIFDGKLGGCHLARSAYLEFLYNNKIITQNQFNTLRFKSDPSSDKEHRIPGCAMFARFGEELMGKAPRWAGCEGYENTRAHLERCLPNYLSATYGSLENARRRLRNCDDVIENYRYAVKLAAPGRMPANFTAPDCDQVMLVLRGGPREAPPELAACDGYLPRKGATHVEACLADYPMVINLRTCLDARRAYEERLIRFYGELPRNYVVMRCSYAKGMLEMAEKKRQEVIERMRAERQRLAEIRRKRLEAENRYWREVMAKGERALKGMNVTRGPLVDAGKLAPVPLEEKVPDDGGGTPQNGTGNDAFRDFEQPGILKALYHNRKDLLAARRRDVIMYLATFGDTLGGEDVAENFPECRPYFPALTIQNMQDELLDSVGMLPDPNDMTNTGMQGLATGLVLLRELMTNGYGRVIQADRNIDLLKGQAENDAFRFAAGVGCGSNISKRVQQNALDFIHSR